MTEQNKHQPVLLDEAIEALSLRAEGVYMDATFGRGGHTQAILDRLGPNGRVIAFDKDPQAIAYGREKFADEPRLTLIHSSYARVLECAEQAGLAGQVDGFLLDAGVSSPQLDQADRGFSFSHDGPLDMRMDTTQGQPLSSWLLSASEDEIVPILKEYGEERFARRIARAIVERCVTGEIETTGELAAIISNAMPRKEPGKHPATRSFQAFRIFINRELDELKTCLQQCLGVLGKGGRLAVISFHSLEDRIVKRFMREQERGDRYPAGLPVTQEQLQPRLKRCGKAVRPTSKEVDDNPRARSATLRVAEKLS